jgi:hypothetical protein
MAVGFASRALLVLALMAKYVVVRYVLLGFV